jgi:hypothetical protein
MFLTKQPHVVGMLNQVLSFLGKKKRTWTMDWNWTEMEFA